MIKKTFPYCDKVRNYSSIFNKLFDVTTVSLVLTLPYFSFLDIDLFCFGNRPAGCDSCQKAFETKLKLLSRSTLIFR